jgi:hypothetical protein
LKIFFPFPKGFFLRWHGEEGGLVVSNEEMDQGLLKYDKLIREISLVFLKGKKKSLNWMQFVFKVNLVQFSNKCFFKKFGLSFES